MAAITSANSFILDKNAGNRFFFRGSEIAENTPGLALFWPGKGGYIPLFAGVFFGVQVLLPLGGPFLSDRALPVSGVCQTVLAASAIVIW